MTTMEEKRTKALDVLCERYTKMIRAAGDNYSPVCMPGQETNYGHLLWMIDRIYSGEMGWGKANRWLAFVQTVLIMNHLTTVTIERDYTRPLFEWTDDE